MQWVHWNATGPIPEAKILVEGLPGVGHVGHLVAEHLVASLPSTLVAQVHSPDFPPQALVEHDGTARLVGYRIWSVAQEADAPALLVLTGDTQPLSAHGQFEITAAILERVAAAGVDTVYTLGGVPGPGAPEVLGAGSDPATVSRLQEAGARSEGPGPEGGIFGASGVFLGLAGLRGMSAGCLMGRSGKSPVDVPAATSLLAVLGRLLGRRLPTDGIDEVAASVGRRLDALEELRYFAAPADADHHYIG